MTMSAAHDLLAALAAAGQIGGFAVDSEGFASVRLEDGTAVDFRADGDRLYVYSSLGSVPKDHEELVLTGLLAANLAGGSGEGPSFALDPNLEDIVLFRELDARSVDAAGLLDRVASLAGEIADWRQRLADVGLQPAEEAHDQRPNQLPLYLMLRA
jgi:hypothetical protein